MMYANTKKTAVILLVILLCLSFNFPPSDDNSVTGMDTGSRPLSGLANVPPSVDFRGVAWADNGQIALVVGLAGAVYRFDAYTESWTNLSSQNGEDFYGVDWSGTEFIIVGDGRNLGTNSVYHTDGYYPLQNIDECPKVMFHDVTANKNEFVAVGDGEVFRYVLETSEEEYIPEDTIMIYNVHDLQAMNQNLTANYALANDIDARETSGWNGGAGFEPVGTGSSTIVVDHFTGSLNGRGYTITGLHIDRPTTRYIGLFGTIGTDAVVKNVGLIDSSITGTNRVGGLVGYNYMGDVFNSYTTGSITGDDRVGGLIGQNDWFAYNSYSMGSVTGTDVTSVVGGLIGLHTSSGSLNNSYSTGQVDDGWNVGGLVGENNGGIVENSFWDTETSGQMNSDGGTGKTTTEMMTLLTFEEANWDFTNTGNWWMADGETRPFLRMEWSTEISNSHQLQMMAMNLSADYVLTDDIDLSDVLDPASMWGTSPSQGAGFKPIAMDFSGPFKGSLDGRGHTITGLFINRPNTEAIGLFGYVDGWDVSMFFNNVGLVDINITGRDYVGGLVAYSMSGAMVDNSYATGSVSGNDCVGGLIGENFESYINNSFASVNVTGASEWSNGIGGLAGTNRNNADVFLSNSYATGNVMGSDNVGGLVGYVTGLNISNSYATGHVIGTRDDVGGFVGNLDSINNVVYNSYSTGDVSGRENVGGFVGYNYRGKVFNSYSTGNVSGNPGTTYYVGGFIGRNNQGNITNCYSTGRVTYEGQEDPVDKGFAGAVDADGTYYEMRGNFWDVETSGQTGSAGSEDFGNELPQGRTTQEMKVITTFTGAEWNIIYVADVDSPNPDYDWNIVDTETYPFLSWEGTLHETEHILEGIWEIVYGTDMNEIYYGLTPANDRYYIVGYNHTRGAGVMYQIHYGTSDMTEITTTPDWTDRRLYAISWCRDRDYGLVVGNRTVQLYQGGNWIDVIGFEGNDELFDITWLDDKVAYIVGKNTSGVGILFSYTHTQKSIAEIPKGGLTPNPHYGVAVRPNASPVYALSVGDTGSDSALKISQTSQAADIITDVQFPKIQEIGIYDHGEVGGMQRLNTQIDVNSGGTATQKYTLYVYVDNKVENEMFSVDVYAWYDNGILTSDYPNENDENRTRAFRFRADYDGFGTTFSQQYPYAVGNQREVSLLVNYCDAQYWNNGTHDIWELIFTFAPGPQMRHANGLDGNFNEPVYSTVRSEGLSTTNTWNLHISANGGESNMYGEFGVYRFTSLTLAGVTGTYTGLGAPGQTIELTATSSTIVNYSANCNHTLKMYLETDLIGDSGVTRIGATNLTFKGGYGNSTLTGYGEFNSVYILGNIGSWYAPRNRFNYTTTATNTSDENGMTDYPNIIWWLDIPMGIPEDVYRANVIYVLEHDG